MAECILKAQGIKKEAGNSWIKRFLKRNKRLKTKPQAPLEASRAASDLLDRINRFFDRYEELQQRHHF
jgi:hypothetical protein